MPEYFNISFIAKRSDSEKSLLTLARKMWEFDLGENSGDVIFDARLYPHLSSKQIIFSYYAYEETDFDELCVSIPDFKLHLNTLEIDLRPISDMVLTLASRIPEIRYVVCSYEMNAYHLSLKNSIEKIDESFLRLFPIVYICVHDHEPKRLLHPSAQGIF